MKTDLASLLRRTKPPVPWAEGETIPWNEPGFSRRMLKEHLTQAHAAASRRFETIDLHVQWLSGLLPQDRPAYILDLGCGPGLYAQRFAAAGHAVTGIDFSPASIDYARAQAALEGFSIDYRLEDLRTADYGTGHDLAMLIFGEFNVFRPSDARLLLDKMHAALATGGLLVLEPHPFIAIRKIGEESLDWYTTEKGLFADEPYLCLQENFWEAGAPAATTRYFIVDLATGAVQQHSGSMQAYTDAQYQALLEDHGFSEVAFHPSLTGSKEGAHSELFVLTARK